MPKLSMHLFSTSSHTVNVRLKDGASNYWVLNLLSNSVCFYPIQTNRTSLLDHLANNHICIFLFYSNYITENIPSISLHHHYEPTRLQITLGLAWSGSWTSPPRGAQVAGGVAHPSQRGQQAAANVCHGKRVPAVNGMKRELQIKHSKIFWGVKKKKMDVCVVCKTLPQEILPVFIHIT